MKKPKSIYTKARFALREAFNLFIRIRDTKADWGNCISCNKPIQFNTSNCQAGHFISAGNYPATEFDERNVNGQCYHCNMRMQGNYEGYERGMVTKYGQKVVDELKIKKHNSSSRDSELLKILESQYIKKGKDIMKQFKPNYIL